MCDTEAHGATECAAEFLERRKKKLVKVSVRVAEDVGKESQAGYLAHAVSKYCSAARQLDPLRILQRMRARNSEMFFTQHHQKSFRLLPPVGSGDSRSLLAAAAAA